MNAKTTVPLAVVPASLLLDISSCLTAAMSRLPLNANIEISTTDSGLLTYGAALDRVLQEVNDGLSPTLTIITRTAP